MSFIDAIVGINCDAPGCRNDILLEGEPPAFSDYLLRLADDKGWDAFSDEGPHFCPKHSRKDFP